MFHDNSNHEFKHILFHFPLKQKSENIPHKMLAHSMKWMQLQKLHKTLEPVKFAATQYWKNETLGQNHFCEKI